MNSGGTTNMKQFSMGLGPLPPKGGADNISHREGDLGVGPPPSKGGAEKKKSQSA